MFILGLGHSVPIKPSTVNYIYVLINNLLMDSLRFVIDNELYYLILFDDDV